MFVIVYIGKFLEIVIEELVVFLFDKVVLNGVEEVFIYIFIILKGEGDFY